MNGQEQDIKRNRKQQAGHDEWSLRTSYDKLGRMTWPGTGQMPQFLEQLLRRIFENSIYIDYKENIFTDEMQKKTLDELYESNMAERWEKA